MIEISKSLTTKVDVIYMYLNNPHTKTYRQTDGQTVTGNCPHIYVLMIKKYHTNLCDLL